MNSNNIIKILGLSKRAGKLAVGEDPVHELASNKKARLILIASDAADNTVKRANNISNKLSIPVVTLTSTKAELGHILSRKSCAVCALSDSGFCANITSKLALENPEYTELANEFKEKHNKILLRKKKKPKTKKTAAKLTDDLTDAESKETTSGESIQSPAKAYNKDSKYSKDKARLYNSDDKKGSYNKDNKYSKDKSRPYNSDDKKGSYNKDSKYSKDKSRPYNSDDKKGSYNKDNKYSKDRKNTNSTKTAIKWSDFKREQGRTRFSPK